jgi:hypothetical protein
MEPPYVLIVLASASKAIKAESTLRAAGVEAVLMAVPRAVSSQCGVCLRVSLAKRQSAQEILGEAGIAVAAVCAVDDRLENIAGSTTDKGETDE